jgi:hypothetical protein
MKPSTKETDASVASTCCGDRIVRSNAGIANRSETSLLKGSTTSISTAAHTPQTETIELYCDILQKWMWMFWDRDSVVIFGLQHIGLTCYPPCLNTCMHCTSCIYWFAYSNRKKSNNSLSATITELSSTCVCHPTMNTTSTTENKQNMLKAKLLYKHNEINA